GVYGHRGDGSYEARVYRDVLHPLHISTPTFYGVYRDKTTGVPWLVIEYLKGGIQTSHSRDPNAMVRAARWIGRFHAANRRRVPSERLRFLRTYDEAYYAGWARRTKELFAPLENRLPWLLPLCDDFGTSISRLLEAPRTVIHGEYFGLNVIYHNGTSWPADWQAPAPSESSSRLEETIGHVSFARTHQSALSPSSSMISVHSGIGGIRLCKSRSARCKDSAAR